MKHKPIFLLILMALIITACTPHTFAAATPETPIDMSNPASVHCTDRGGELEIRDEAGGQVGYCIFPDGSECEEWAFYRGECAPDSQEGVGLPNPASVHCTDQGGELEIRDETDGQVGYCIFPDGSECEEWAFYRGECAGPPDPAAGASAEVTRYNKGYRFEQNGWIYLHIEGEPHERGFQHGYLLAPELAEIIGNFKELTYWDTGKEWEFFVDQAVEQFAERIDPEYLEEIKGIADGAQAAGTEITWQEVLTWNGYEELLGYWWPNELAGKYAQPDDDHCSAFIATGSATKDGKIVMAHNSWDQFAHGQFLNVILDLEPAQGQRMFMQSAPGFIASFTDFFVTGAGIMGTETTIGGYSEYDPDEDPEFFRIRNAMQYANTLDEFVQLMEKKNNGGYANSWLLADANTGEIMRFELGLQYQNVERTKDGYFVGFNAAVDPRIRNLETSNSGYDDIRTPAGARRVRLTQLMEEHQGKIDVEVAEEILADHYDVYLNKENPGSRTVEGHYELDAFEFWPARMPFAPQGAVDGKVMDSDMANDLSFWARWGSSSGMPFDAEKHISDHPQWDHLQGYLKDRSSQPWTLFSAGEGQPESAAAPSPAPSPAPSLVPTEAAEHITARMLVEPDALVGPGPSHLQWSPQGATLAYVAPEDGQELLWLYDATTGEKRVLLDPAGHDDNIVITSAQWSPLGDTLLLRGEEALWLVDVETGELTSLAEGGSKTAVTFSPTGEMVSYVQDNDLFTVRIADGEIQQLTSDGSETVFNGTLDWVYNEEFATRVAQPAYTWSPDGEWLVYLRLDDEAVQQHPVTDFRTVPPTVSYTRYPTAGSPNPAATLHLIGFEDGEPSQPILLPEDAEYILPFFTWDPGSGEVLYLAEGRDRTILQLHAWNPATNTGRTVIQETDPDWINELLYVAPVFLNEEGQFLWLSERDGFMHIYLYSREGELIRQVTEGEWLVDSLPWDLLTPGRPVHVDPSGTWAYFSTTQVSPLERHLYRLNIENGEMEQLSQEAGFHFAALSSDGQYLVEQFSSVDIPPVTLILKADGSLAEILGRSAGPSLDLPEVSREFLTIEAHDGVELYAQIVKPENFNPERKYPVVIHWYGGPTLQMVSNRYGTDNVFNHIERDVIYTQEDFIVWRLDNRGSFGRGHAFETPIAGHLGPAAFDDQLAGVEYLQSLPYVDADRIGADGKSFGGFLTLYALIHEPELLAAGVAGSGPTDWSTYDTVYTERYMGTPEQNPEGYEATELISRVDQLQVRPLIIHGLADTNVHLQNSVNLMDAMMQIDKPFDFLPLPNSDHHYGGDGLVGVLSESANYFTQHFQPIPAAAPTSPDAPISMPNPASQYCVDQGGELEIRDEADGQVGYCLFPDGSECEEWSFYRGDCEPGS